MLFANDDDNIDSDSNTESYNEENIIVEEIISYSAIAVYNASVNIDIMAKILRITNKHNDNIIEGFNCNNKWELCVIKSVEALTLL